MQEPADDPAPLSAPPSAPTDVHLVLLLHGLYGSSANLWCLEEEIERAHAASDCGLELHILNAREYGGALTWDGIDVNAHRVAREVNARCALECAGLTEGRSTRRLRLWKRTGGASPSSASCATVLQR
jgi:hypothetical protein